MLGGLARCVHPALHRSPPNAFIQPQIVQLICPIKQPVVCRPVHAVRLLRFVRTVIASELPRDSLGSKRRPVGAAQALAE